MYFIRFSLSLLLFLFVSRVIFGMPPNRVEVQGRQLLVNGVPFMMKGVCYHPVRKGETVPDGLMTLNPTEEDLLVIENDFRMIRYAGFNTIRTYEPITHPKILELLNDYQLKVIVPVCLAWEKYQNLASIEDLIKILQKEPSTLFWEIGNEWNFNHFYTDFIGAGSDSQKLKAEDCDEIIKNISRLIRKGDLYKHPIGTDIMLLDNAMKTIYPGITPTIDSYIDLYGVNVYDGTTFGKRFHQWESMSKKPFYLGEFGAVAYNENTQHEDPDDQDHANLLLFTEILENVSAKNPEHILIGGCLFEFCDEWWKGGNPDPSTHRHGGITVDHGPFPSNCFDDEYFGLVEIDRTPRPTYFSLKRLLEHQN
jgi:hypothetical protein